MPSSACIRALGAILLSCTILGGCGYASPSSSTNAYCMSVASVGGQNSAGGPSYQQCIGAAAW